MQPLQICIGPIIRIGRESWCLPYAGFFIYILLKPSLKVCYWNSITNWALSTMIQWLCPDQRPRQVKISSVTLGALLEGTGGRNDIEPPNTGHNRTSARDDGLSGRNENPKQGIESQKILNLLDWLFIVSRPSIARGCFTNSVVVHYRMIFIKKYLKQSCA